MIESQLKRFQLPLLLISVYQRFTSNLILKKIRKHQFGPRMAISGQGTGSDTSELHTH